MKYTSGEIAKILDGIIVGDIDYTVTQVSIDSRSISTLSVQTIFIALSGNMVDGHRYVQSAYDKGVRVFLVNKKVDLPSDAITIIVQNTLEALQEWAAYHRKLYNIPVISITGSNGKTIVKEWLSQLLSAHYNVVKSPKSYNSQIGVPLSVLLMDETHEIAVLEAGISKVDEMKNLQKIIQPSIGIFTNIGDAHSSGFKSKEEKFSEKAILFENSDSIIYNQNDSVLAELIEEKYNSNQLHPYRYEVQENGKTTFHFYGKSMDITLPFKDEASIQNTLASISVMCLLGIDIIYIEKELKQLNRIQMRLETKAGKYGSTIINDAYSSDLQSLENAILYLKQTQVENPLIILSDLEENQAAEILYPKVAEILNSIDHTLIAIGKESKRLSDLVRGEVIHHKSIGSLLLNKSLVAGRTILLKGARRFKFEQLQKQLAAQSHSATLEIDLSAMEHNLSVYASMLPADTNIMTVVKASAYGSGATELAKHLQHRQVAYMAVAYIDEGIQLRSAGITTPILVLNPDLDQLQEMVDYKLEPEVYDIEQLMRIVLFINQEKQKDFPPIHLKLDTGMHRLGFQTKNFQALMELLMISRLKVASIFSHLAASDDPTHKTFTERQIALFNQMADAISKWLGYQPLRHIANTAAISRYPDAHLDMVRLGLGLYGIDSKLNTSEQLERVHTLLAKVIQVKTVKKGETVGYNRTHTLDRDSQIAIINIGYADGLMRNSGNGRHQVLLHNQLCPIIGNVCMDLTIIDVTKVNHIEIGDTVEVFGKSIDIVQLAKINNTIPYEVLAGISTRVKKVYVRS